MLHVTCYIFLGNPAWLACSLHALDPLHAIWGPTAAAFQIGNKIIVNCACAEHARPFYSNVIVMPQLAIANSGNNIIVCFPWPIPNFVETTSFSCDAPSSGDMIIILCTHVHVFLQCRMPIHVHFMVYIHMPSTYGQPRPADIKTKFFYPCCE